MIIDSKKRSQILELIFIYNNRAIRLDDANTDIYIKMLSMNVVCKDSVKKCDSFIFALSLVSLFSIILIISSTAIQRWFH